MYFEMIRVSEVEKFIGRKDSIIIDVRKEEEYRQGHIRTAKNVPYEQGDNIARYVNGYDYILLYCCSGTLSLMAARDLYGVNSKVYSLCGGIRAYKGILERT